MKRPRQQKIQCFCSEYECVSFSIKRELCIKHYKRKQRSRSSKPRWSTIFCYCKVEGCANPNSTKGLCRKHRISYLKTLPGYEDQVIAKSKRYRAKHQERIRARKRAWKKANPGKCSYENRQREIAKIKRIPQWLTKEDLQLIKEFYINRPKGYHVDHIVPLQGKNVSGLHCPWNLQYLPALENIRKGNRL